MTACLHTVDGRLDILGHHAVAVAILEANDMVDPVPVQLFLLGDSYVSTLGGRVDVGNEVLDGVYLRIPLAATLLTLELNYKDGLSTGVQHAPRLLGCLGRHGGLLQEVSTSGVSLLIVRVCGYVGVSAAPPVPLKCQS